MFALYGTPLGGDFARETNKTLTYCMSLVRHCNWDILKIQASTSAIEVRTLEARSLKSNLLPTLLFSQHSFKVYQHLECRIARNINARPRYMGVLDLGEYQLGYIKLVKLYYLFISIYIYYYFFFKTIYIAQGGMSTNSILLGIFVFHNHSIYVEGQVTNTFKWCIWMK